MLAASVSALAHSGGTDSQGGHTDHSTGEYHYHHGYPPHDHIDGRCPYTDKELKAQRAAENQRRMRYTFAALLVGAFAVGAVPAAYHSAKRKKEQRRQEKAFQAEKQEYALLYEGKQPEDMVEIPNGTWIDESTDLPKSKGTGKWGSLYTRYVSKNGTKYHMQGCKYAYIPVHAINVKRRGLEPCKLCNSYLPDLKWYEDYLEIKNKKKMYGIK